jgi:hypothetical protein
MNSKPPSSHSEAETNQIVKISDIRWLEMRVHKLWMKYAGFAVDVLGTSQINSDETSINDDCTELR